MVENDTKLVILSVSWQLGLRMVEKIAGIRQSSASQQLGLRMAEDDAKSVYLALPRSDKSKVSRFGNFPEPAKSL